MFDAQGVADLFVAVATVAAAVFAGWQVRELVRQQREVKRLETQAVSVMWEPTVAPHKADADGSAAWVLEVTLTNPGRMPIDNVLCTLHFDRPVQRLRHDGTADEPAMTLDLAQTVLLGGSTRSWTAPFELGSTPMSGSPVRCGRRCPSTTCTETRRRRRGRGGKCNAQIPLRTERRRGGCGLTPVQQARTEP